MSSTIQIKRGTRSAISDSAIKGELLQGEPLFITDEDRFAVATSPSTYQDFAKTSEASGGGGATWGSIGGVLSNQTDLQTALNAKENSIASGTTLQYFRGDKTWRDFFTDVRAATLTGLSTATNAAIAAADTVLVAFGKLQAQINAHFGAGGTAHANATTTVAGFMSGTDKTKLDGIAAGAQVNVATNLSEGTRTTTTVGINSSTGTSATLSAVSGTLAGVMTSADKTKLDGIATGATANTGTVTSVSATVPAFLSVSGVPITGAGTIAITYSGTALPLANGGTGATTAAGARTNFGASTVGSNLFTLANPTAVTFLRVNADNTVSALDATTFRTAIGAGTSSTTGTVTSVSGTGTVSGLTLSGTVTSTGNLTLGGTLAVSASNFSSQTANTFLAAPNGTTGVPTFRSIVAADVPTLNQNTTGTASNVTGTVAVTNGGTGATDAATARTNLGAQETLVSGTNIKTVGGVSILGSGDIPISGGAGGTVTSVDATVPDFLSVSGVPITGAGTIAITYSGTALPLANGGTGSTTAAGARTNLGATSRSTGFPAGNENSVAAGDIRNITNPLTGLGYADGVRFRFSSLNDDSLTPYADVMDLSTYQDSSGGGFNALYFSKASQLMQHKFAVAGGTSWTTKTLAYTDSNITGTSANVTGTVALLNGGTGSTTAAGARTNLGLGTAATVNTGTSGATIPLLNGNNSWSGSNTFANAAGAEGGEIQLQLPVSGTNLTNNIAIDINGNLVRIFEAGGAARGANFNVTQCVGGAAAKIEINNGVSVISTNTTAIVFRSYVCTAALTLTLPASPTAGDWVEVSNRSSVTTIVIARNAQNIMGLAEDMTVNVLNAGFKLLFIDATRGWIII